MDAKKKPKNMYSSTNQPKKRKGNISVVEKTRRIDFAIEQLLKALPRGEVKNLIMKEFDVTQTTAYTYIGEASQLIKSSYNMDIAATINIHINKYYEIVKDNDKFDGKTQIQALQAIEKLLGLHKPDALIQNNTLNLDLKDYSINDLKQLLSHDS